MKSNIRSATQGISGKTVKVGKMFSDHGAQTVTAKGKAEISTMDNRGHRPRSLPFSYIKIKEVNIIKLGLSLIDSVIDCIRALFKFFQKS